MFLHFCSDVPSSSQVWDLNFELVVDECRSQWPRLLKAYVCGRSLAGIVGSDPDEGMECCECCMLSERGLCNGPIPHPEESYRVCVCVSLNMIVQQ